MTSQRVAAFRHELRGEPETTRAFTPLGIRFWDPSLDVAITDALEVSAWQRGQPHRARQAIRTSSGIYAFNGLPGLRDVEYPGRPGAVEFSPPQTRRFLVQVRDRKLRFLPALFNVDLPQYGIYPSNTVRPGADPLPGLYLFSSAARAAEPGLAAIRAQLVDADSGRPVAFALVEVEDPRGRLLYGVADANGSVVVMFTYPAFRPGASASPPGNEPPGTQVWPLRIRLRYQPGLLTTLDGTGLPDLRGVLSQQAAGIQPDRNSSATTEEIVAELEFGRELVLRTMGLAHLLVGQVTSPP